MTTFLSGDIGGTKTHLALHDADNPVAPLRTATFASRDWPGLEALCAAFLQPGDAPQSAAFGIAGPVLDGRVVTTNLPWIVDPAPLSAAIGTPRIALLNDLEALALGALHLPAADLHVIQPGTRRPGHVAVLAAGTGLGQAQLFWDGARHRPGATEGGHVEFAPADEADQELLAWARLRLQRAGAGSHVSWERLVAGPGLGWIAEFLRDHRGLSFDPAVEPLMHGEDIGAQVGQAGVDGRCALCREAVRYFVRLYARQAGNFALTIMALGGVLLGGGIAPKILPLLDSEAFREAFCAKGRYQSLMAQLPVSVILDQQAGLKGAAIAAFSLL